MTSKMKNRIDVARIDGATAQTAASSQPRIIPIAQSADAVVILSLPAMAVQTIVENFPAVAVATRNRVHLLKNPR
jgi:hypothetical protein